MRLAATTFALALSLAACGQSEEDATTGIPIYESESAPIGPDGAPTPEPSLNNAEPTGAQPIGTTAPGTAGNTPLRPDGSVDPEAVGETYQDYVGETN